MPLHLKASTTSGVPALALDVWLSYELRRAGFVADQVWPRPVHPRILPAAAANLIKSLPGALRNQVADRVAKMSSIPGVTASSANILGKNYLKQVDVIITDWVTGPELLISTKRMDSSYGKNAPNRIEESYGDAKNLRLRHPLAALGFAFGLRSDILQKEPKTAEWLFDLLAKLGQEDDAYHATCLVMMGYAAPAATGTRKEQFVLARDTGSDLNSGGLVPPMSPNTILAGSVIAASLITGLNSDLPGMVTAQVTQNVFDTVTGSILLVPQGARLIGKYDSVVAFGQRRALVIWQRLILPDGSSVRLDNMPATDPSGYAGLADKVDFHTWTLLKGVAIATMLGVGSELTISGESDLVQAIRESAQSNTARAGDQITQRNLDIQPTITIRPGAPVRVLVTRDLVLEPRRGGAGPWN